MSVKVKIIGAGSIGNHLAQASRRIGWDVTVVDANRDALKRMKDDIYPTRYGMWDSRIKLAHMSEEPKGGFDIVMIGTPPDSHLKLALAALREKPRVLQIEKPLCPPCDPLLSRFLAAAKKSRTKIIVGYDHTVGASIEYVASHIQMLGTPLTLDVEFREHWQGIFKAHPWLSGPSDSYLGYWKRGGGASGEHSHALHLYQYLAKEMGLGTWKKVVPHRTVEKAAGGVQYDSVASFGFEMSKGRYGRVIQDVITLPTRKWARAQGSDGFIEWICGGSPKGDIE